MQLTAQQQAIVDFGRNSKDDLLIEALAGTGKTSTLLELVKAIPQKSILLCAFNKSIQTELQKKAPKVPGKVLHVKTFHSLGLSVLEQYYSGIKVDKDRSEELVSQAVARHGRAQQKVKWAAIRLLKTYKEASYRDDNVGASYRDPGMSDPEDWEHIGESYGLFERLDTEAQIEQSIELAMTAYDFSLAQFSEPSATERPIDFCDMIWLPLELNLAPKSRYKAVIVDEWQDLSEPQLNLVQRLVAPDGRLIMAGDYHQCIYRFRGATADLVRAQMTHRRAVTMPMTTTFRCAKAVALEATALVPGFAPAPDADDGSVRTITYGDLPRALAQYPSPDKVHTFVLSRTNFELIDCAIFLSSERIRFRFGNPELLDEIMFLLNQMDLSGDVRRFCESVNVWAARETAKADRANATAKIAKIADQVATLQRLGRVGGPSRIRSTLEAMATDTSSGVLLSTVHKVKGLEAQRVYLLKQTFKRHKKEGLHPNIVQEEFNIEYVAITRARTHLTWVDLNQTEPMSWVVPGNVPLFFGDQRLTLTEDALDALITELSEEAVRLTDLGFTKRADLLNKNVQNLRQTQANAIAAKNARKP